MTQPELGCQEFYSGGGESYEGRLELKQQKFSTGAGNVFAKLKRGNAIIKRW
jgi:hypothetical protein